MKIILMLFPLERLLVLFEGGLAEIEILVELSPKLNNKQHKEIKQKISSEEYGKYLEGKMPKTVWTMKIKPTKKI